MQRANFRVIDIFTSGDVTSKISLVDGERVITMRYLPPGNPPKYEEKITFYA